MSVSLWLILKVILFKNCVSLIFEYLLFSYRKNRLVVNVGIKISRELQLTSCKTVI